MSGVKYIKTNKQKEYSLKNDKYNEIASLMKSNVYNIAFARAKEFLLDYPDDVYGQIAYARCLIKTGKKEEGISKLLELKDTKMKDKARRYAYKVLLRYYNKSNIPYTEKLLNEAKKLKIFDEYDEKIFEVDLLFAKKDNKAALELLSTIKPKTELQKESVFLYKICHSTNNYFVHNYEENINILEGICRKNNNNKIMALSMLGKCRYLNHDYQRAHECYSRLINNYNSNYMDHLLYEYTTCLRLHLYEDASKYLKLIKEKTLLKDENLSLNSLSAVKIIEGKYDEAIALYEKEPLTNILDVIQCCNLYIRKQKYGKAINMLEEFAKNNIDKIDSIFSLNLINLYLATGQYEKAYNYLILNKDDSYEYRVSFDQILIFLNKKIPINYQPKYEEKYTSKQLSSYNYAEALEHIRKHLEEDDNKKIHCVFNKNIEIETLLEEIRPKLTDDKIVGIGPICKYMIEYPYIGSVNGIDLHHLFVLIELGTTNIINCFPSHNIMEFDSEIIDENEEIEEVKVKRLTQIEKFNRRYNIS